MTITDPEHTKSQTQRVLKDFERLKDAVLEAGEIAMTYFGNDPYTQKKADGSEVSEADYKVNEHLFDRLASAQDGYGWLSEESELEDTRLTASRVWVVDPIDGTRGFLRKATDWTIAVGLLEDGFPVVGCVYAPARNEFYAAVKGQSATLNENPITVSNRTSLAGAKVIANKAILKSDTWIGPLPDIELVWSNSMAYRLCLVACAKADATISLSSKSDWDIAAAHAILNAAGGTMTVDAGKTARYNKKEILHNAIIAANPNISDALLDRVRRKH